MSRATLTYYLTCDRGSCPVGVTVSTGLDEAIQTEGWTRQDGKDYCPDHEPKPKVRTHYTDPPPRTRKPRP